MRVRVLNGLNYPDGTGGEKRAEPGEIVDDLPTAALPWLLGQGHVEVIDESPVEAGSPARSSRKEK